jgi:hypothetical protein
MEDDELNGDRCTDAVCRTVCWLSETSVRQGMPRRSKRPGTVKRVAVTFEQVRMVARAFPGIEDSTSYGTPALKVRGKLLARLHQSGECFVLRTELLDREILMQSDPQVFFITDHYRDYPWILVRFSVDPGELPNLIERAWRLVAPKSLVAKHEGGTKNL